MCEGVPSELFEFAQMFFIMILLLAEQDITITPRPPASQWVTGWSVKPAE
jgi:hypothetical protein